MYWSRIHLSESRRITNGFAKTKCCGLHINNNAVICVNKNTHTANGLLEGSPLGVRSSDCVSNHQHDPALVTNNTL